MAQHRNIALCGAVHHPTHSSMPTHKLPHEHSAMLCRTSTLIAHPKTAYAATSQQPAASCGLAWSFVGCSTAVAKQLPNLLARAPASSNCAHAHFYKSLLHVAYL
jgi:hypothetical protein